jgi:pyruvate kinase
VRGREIRTSDIDEGSNHFVVTEQGQSGILLKSGHQVFLGCENSFLKSSHEKIYCNYRDLPKIIKPNDIIYIDDGKIVLLVTDCEPVCPL